MTNLQYHRIEIERGMPFLRDSRVPVEDVIDMLAQGLSFEQIAEAWDRNLDREDILA